MNAVRRRSTTAVLLAVTLLAAGCSGDSVRFLGEKVKEPEQFLTSIEQAWRSELSKGRVNVHKEARCYFSQGEESTDIDGLAFCGPARHYLDEQLAEGEGELTGTDAPGALNDGVWDTYTFKGEAIEGGYQLANPAAETRGANVPPAVTLFRLDDKEPPADADKLAAPPPPSAKPGFIGVTSPTTTDGNSQVSAIDAVKIKSPIRLSSSPLETPVKTYQLGAAGTTDRIKTSEGTRTAAPNEEFLVGEFSSTEGPWSDAYPDADDYSTWDNSFPEEDMVNVSPAFTLITSSSRVALPFEGDGTIVVSVPKGDRSASLEIAASGRVQMISFRTGEITGVVPDTTSVGLNYQYGTQKVHVDEPDDSYEFDGSHFVRFVNALRTPFHPQKGWAAKGKTWLLLETADADYEYDLGFFDISRDIANTATARAKGVTYRNVGEPVGDWDRSTNKSEWPVFEVDETVKSFQITYQPTWRFTGKGVAPSGTARFKPMVFNITFG